MSILSNRIRNSRTYQAAKKISVGSVMGSAKKYVQKRVAAPVRTVIRAATQTTKTPTLKISLRDRFDPTGGRTIFGIKGPTYDPNASTWDKLEYWRGRADYYLSGEYAADLATEWGWADTAEERQIARSIGKIAPAFLFPGPHTPFMVMSGTAGLLKYGTRKAAGIDQWQYEKEDAARKAAEEAAEKAAAEAEGAEGAALAAAENPAAYADAIGEMNESAIDTAQTLNPVIMEEFYKVMEQALPGFRGIVGDMSQFTSALLSGQLPPDVQAYLEMVLNEQGLQRGISGSEIGRNLVARDLGKTSLDLMQQGFGNATSLIQTARTQLFPPIVDIAGAAGQYSQTIAPYTMLTAGEMLQNQQFNAQMAYARSVDAATRAQEQWRIQEEQRMMRQAIAAGYTKAGIEGAFQLASALVSGK